MTPEKEIFKALLDHLNEMDLDGMEIAMPNVTYEPHGAPYLKVSDIRAETFRNTTRANRHQGLFQVSVFWPEGEGETKPLEVAGKIVSHFRLGTRMVGDEGTVVRVLRPPYAMTSQEEPGWTQVPTRIPYLADWIEP